jgi:glucose-1-phosphate thymidylyltransferase
LIISTLQDLPLFKKLLGDGSQIGILIEYAVQTNPDGLVQALLIGEKFIGNNPVTLILGDNIFYGSGLIDKIQHAQVNADGATVFTYYVNEPSQYGVVNLDENENIISIEEKLIMSMSHLSMAL